ncbi:MAG: wax ester/triacylglycerol synthase family O-acyltransferase, partial [Myxococcota bacterium]
DRTKPLWEMWIAEGFEDDRWVLLSKTHHCMVDGVSGTDLLTVLLDDRPDPEREEPEPWEPSEPASEIQLVRDALQERWTSPYEMVRSLRAVLRTPRRLVEVARGLRTFSRLAGDGAASSLNGPIGPHRRWSWTRSTLDRVRAIRKLHGGTVNDVVLAAIARGFRDLLQSRGEEVDGQVVRTLVPVSVRPPGDEATPNNQVSAMFAELPVGISDPLDRLAAVRAQLDDLKERKQAVAADALVSLSGFAPPMLLALGARAFSRIPQSSVQTVTTNVPGPPRELYAAGRKLRRVFPYVPLAGRVRIGVAIFSYAGQLNFGVTGDYETCADLDVLCRGIDAGIAELSRGV